MKTIVIARYKESIDWIEDLPLDVNIVVYDKGKDGGCSKIRHPKLTVVERENVGRESETYAFHILSNPNPGPGITIFCQGDPFEHSPQFIEIVKNFKRWSLIQPLSCQWSGPQAVPPKPLVDKRIEKNTSRFQIAPEYFSLYTWGPIDFLDVGALNIGRQYRALHGLEDGTNIAAHFLSSIGHRLSAEHANLKSIGIFAYGAIFSIDNDHMQKTKIEIIEKLHKAAIDHPIHGYIIERLWLHIFGERFRFAI